jgi:hypothetical protein
MSLSAIVVSMAIKVQITGLGPMYPGSKETDILTQVFEIDADHAIDPISCAIFVAQSRFEGQGKGYYAKHAKVL